MKQDVPKPTKLPPPGIRSTGGISSDGWQDIAKACRKLIKKHLRPRRTP